MSSKFIYCSFYGFSLAKVGRVDNFLTFFENPLFDSLSLSSMRSDDESIWRPFCLCKFTTKSFSWMIYLSSLSCTCLFYLTILREDSVEEHSTADDAWLAWFVLCGCLVIDRFFLDFGCFSNILKSKNYVFSCTSFNLFQLYKFQYI